MLSSHYLFENFNTMENKVSFLLDRSVAFGEEKAQLLDELTFAIKNNTGQVLLW